MLLSVECLVIGGGAAGLAAASEAASHGVEVMLVDERKDLRGAQKARPHANVTVLTSSLAWGIFPGGIVSIVTPGDSLDIAPKSTIMATGSQDRLLPFAGWEHQSVVTAGEGLELARALSARMRWVVAGIGDDGAAVARALHARGQEVIYADAAEGGTPHAGPQAGPPFDALPGYVIARVTGHDRIEGVELVRTDGGGEPVRQHADVACVVYARGPRSELAWLSGCEMEQRLDLGGPVPRLHSHVCTSIDGLFAAGDAAGLCGPETAALEGRLAGMLAAEWLGKRPASDADSSRREPAGDLGERISAARRDDAGSLSAWLGVMWHLEERCVRGALASAGTHLCRCELVPGSAVGAALGDIAVTSADVKRATRAGMGECQGQHCRSLIARAVAIRSGRPPGLDRAMSHRPPVRPITIGELIAGDS